MCGLATVRTHTDWAYERAVRQTFAHTLVLGGYIKNRKLAVVNQGPRQSDDQMSGKRVSGMRHLKTALVALSDRQSTNTIMVISRD